MSTSIAHAHVVNLSEPAAGEHMRTGRKAATLSSLKAAGFAVPDGFAVTTDAFNALLEASGIEGAPNTARILESWMPTEIKRAIHKAMATIGDVSVAVRSSGIAEDGTGASFAGQYETILDVRGVDSVVDAVRRCWASAYSERVFAYLREEPLAPLAILVQRMVAADSAGVAFTADPVSGDRESVVVSAVSGTGERLVSGTVVPDEWLVRGDDAHMRHGSEDAITEGQAVEVAKLARRVEAWAGTPQDIEWAIEDGQLWLLQARPITVMPDQVDWAPSVEGVWTRNFRLGEWIPDPLTPLFASWVLPRIERSFASFYANHVTGGLEPPEPHHLIINGWYFSSLNFLPKGPLSKAAAITKLIGWAIRHPRSAAMVVPPTARYGVELFLDDWRQRLHPEYQVTAKDARGRLHDATPSELVDLIDELASAAGQYFASVTLVGGYAWKSELSLAAFWQKHLADLGHSHQEVLIGLGSGSTPYEHAVECLDWFHPTLGDAHAVSGIHNISDGPAAERRRAAESDARKYLTGSRRLQRYEDLLDTAQRYAVIREDQVKGFTLLWPVLRGAALRLGAHLETIGAISQPEDVFFLNHKELTTALASETARFGELINKRREEWKRQRRLTAPATLGRPSKFIQTMLRTPDRMRTGTIPEGAVRGQPASPGRIIGTARVIRSLEEAHRLTEGDILITTATTPAWTPLFHRAAAVVTELGSVVAHASLVAREYGIPAVVGADQATALIPDGIMVLVDGQGGYVRCLEPLTESD